MNIALLVWAILHGFYGLVLAQLDCNANNHRNVLRYSGWLILWPVVLLLHALGEGEYFTR